MKQCESCGKSYAKRSSEAYWQFENRRYCSISCATRARNERVPNERYKARYRTLKTPDGRRMLEHRWVMEQQIGRRLGSNEHVHHINHDRLDNRIENLELVTVAEHAKRHTYPAATKQCVVCEQTFTPHKTKRRRAQTCGRECLSILQSRLNAERKLERSI